MSKPDLHLSPAMIIDGRSDAQAANQAARELADAHTKIVQTLAIPKDKKSIGVSEVRALRQFNLLKSAGEVSVYIVEDSDTLTHEAQNSILKVLEELNDDKYIILAAANPKSLLPTVRSRCQIIRADQILATEELPGIDAKTSMIRDALTDSSLDQQTALQVIPEASNFLRATVADRLTKFKDFTEDREQIMQLILALRVVAVATMRSASAGSTQQAWAKKVLVLNDIEKEAQSNASPKMLMLSLATRI